MQLDIFLQLQVLVLVHHVHVVNFLQVERHHVQIVLLEVIHQIQHLLLVHHVHQVNFQLQDLVIVQNVVLDKNMMELMHVHHVVLDHILQGMEIV